MKTLVGYMTMAWLGIGTPRLTNDHETTHENERSKGTGIKYLTLLELMEKNAGRPIESQ